VDDSKLQSFMNRAIADLGAAMSAVLVGIGDRLGLYRAMADGAPLTSETLAGRTGLAERYVREWLLNQAAGGYVTYDPEAETFRLPSEHAAVLADEQSPYLLAGSFQVVEAAFKAQGAIAERFRTGAGLPWGDHDACLFEGIERAYRPNYVGSLIDSWIPALDGVEAKLKAGARVADVGCGHGTTTLLMAQAFPASSFVGFDIHAGSVETARVRAQEAGLGDRVRFEVAGSTDFPGTGYDLVAHFDSLHDMADPVEAARHVNASLGPEGTWMVVEPYAGDRVEENLTPVGRLMYASSTMFCVPSSLANQGLALGAQAGEARLRAVIAEGGFTRVRCAAATPFNLVLEAGA
jgi:SAM-dependent methyltransferase